ncbi:MAG: hypothetical protein Q9175_002488 [Cornicularia normoerica]
MEDANEKSGSSATAETKAGVAQNASEVEKAANKLYEENIEDEGTGLRARDRGMRGYAGQPVEKYGDDTLLNHGPLLIAVINIHLNRTKQPTASNRVNTHSQLLANHLLS